MRKQVKHLAQCLAAAGCLALTSFPVVPSSTCVSNDCVVNEHPRCVRSTSPLPAPQYAFLVTAAVQFAGGIIIFFGLLVSPEEIGIPGIETEDNFEEDSHRPLINGAENEDEAEPNYSIQEGNTVTQVKAISFYQACCLPGVIAVRTVQISPPKPGRYHSLNSSTAGHTAP